jgi:hypothetical protein
MIWRGGAIRAEAKARRGIAAELSADRAAMDDAIEMLWDEKVIPANSGHRRSRPKPRGDDLRRGAEIVSDKAIRFWKDREEFRTRAETAESGLAREQAENARFPAERKRYEESVEALRADPARRLVEARRDLDHFIVRAQQLAERIDKVNHARTLAKTAADGAKLEKIAARVREEQQALWAEIRGVASRMLDGASSVHAEFPADEPSRLTDSIGEWERRAELAKALSAWVVKCARTDALLPQDLHGV